MSLKRIKFCRYCGFEISFKIPEGDSVERVVCFNCDSIDYENPKIIVGILPVYNHEILLCQRDINPGKKKWTVPSGFLELGETTEEGALREAEEEACIKPVITQLYCVYNLTHIGQVYILYIANLNEKKATPGHETSRVGFFPLDKIPWNNIAFSSVEFVLRNYVSDYPSQVFPLRTGREENE